MASSNRPEAIAPPEIFYNDIEAKKYTRNSRILEIQRKMSERALEMLSLPAGMPSFVLDIGCGSGLSGEVLTEAGHVWAGMDISGAMLGVARARGAGGDLLHADMGDGVPFRPGTFDGAISISAVQWLCNQDRKEHNPRRRLRAFFQTLYNALTRGGKAVLQFYPETPQQMELIVSSAMACGFTGGVVIDYPNSTRAKKYYLVIFAGQAVEARLPEARLHEEGDGMMPVAEDGASRQHVRVHTAKASMKERQRRQRGGKNRVKSRKWIVEKKEYMRKKGHEVKADSKYTGRKRKNRW